MSEYLEDSIEKLKQIVQLKRDIATTAKDLTHHLKHGKGGSFPIIATADFDVWIGAHTYHDVFAQRNGIDPTDEKALKVWFQPGGDQKNYYGRGRIRNNYPDTSFSKLWGVSPEQENKCREMVAEKIENYFKQIR
jgi:hypothetical protein